MLRPCAAATDTSRRIAAAIAGVHAAGDVDRRDEVEQRQLDQFVKRRRGLADVRVQIDVHGEVARLEQKSDGKKKRAPR